MKPFVLLMIWGLSIGMLSAQSPAMLYLDIIQEEFYTIMDAYVDYNAKVVHSDKKNAAEQKRQALVAQIRSSKSKITQMKPMKGGEALKATSISLCDKLIMQFESVHRKALAMRERGEGSYEEMEKFIQYLEEVQGESNKAWSTVDDVFEEYANANGIKVVEDNSKFAQSLKQVGEMNTYQYKIFLIMFRTTKPNLIFWNGIKRKDPQIAAYGLKDLKESIETSLLELEKIGAYKNDDSYRLSVVKVLNYIKASAEKDYPMLIDYYIRAYKPEEDTKKVNKFLETYESINTKNVDAMDNTLERFVKKYTPKNPIKHK